LLLFLKPSLPNSFKWLQHYNTRLQKEVFLQNRKLEIIFDWSQNCAQAEHLKDCLL
jgi:hypothetical protein